MTGTGTSADPFIVSTWADFKTTIAAPGAYIVMNPNAEEKVIDLNDTADAEGLEATLAFNCTSIQGNGWTIRNLYFKPGDYYCFQMLGSRIENLSLLNVVANTSGASIFNIRSNCTFQNCNFSLQHNFGAGRQALMSQYSSRCGTFRNCAIYVKGVGTGVTDSYIQAENFYDCNLYLDLPLCSGASDRATALFIGGTLNNTSVRGVLRLNRLSETVNTTQHLFQSVSISNSYAALACTNLCEFTGGMTLDTLTNNVSGASFVDANLMSDGVTLSVSETSLHTLTTAQCKSAAYLQSIGFPCTEAALI